MINFPATAVMGETFQAAGLVWQFDGTKWVAATVAEEPSGGGSPVTITVSVSTALPADFAGTVMVEQSAPVTITLPSPASVGQQVTVKDALGQAGTHAISIVGIIEGVSGMTISFNYGWVALTWAGGHWVQV